MKVALLSSAGCVHTLRWANALAEHGQDLTIFCADVPLAGYLPEVEVRRMPWSAPAAYLLGGRWLRNELRRGGYQLLNAHYASGYGTLAVLSGFQPMLLSVWGSDVYDFPNKSPLHWALIDRNLRCSTGVLSTSHAMAAQVQTLFPKRSIAAITPFGVDTQRFDADRSTERETITIGTVKTLSPTYGIDTLIRGFAGCRQQLPRLLGERLRLRIVGGGPQQAELEKLADDLGIGAMTEFVGRVPHDQVPGELAKLDVYVAMSRSESFGVAIIEASASGLPVVVSNVGGLPEVVRHEHTGFIVPCDDVPALSDRLVQLAQDPQLRRRIGAVGRSFVRTHYEWDVCVEHMISIYRQYASSAAESGAESVVAAGNEVKERVVHNETTDNDVRHRISIIIPCRNESGYIVPCLRSVLAQDSPRNGRICEILVADGMSDDGTRDEVAALAAAHPQIKIVDNPERIVSTGMNRAIREAQGDIIVRMDAHNEYASDYVCESLTALTDTGAWNVGGPVLARGVGYIQRASAASWHSGFAAGGGRSHDADYEGDIDSVCFGCWRRTTLLELGLFDEELVRNQDDELNFRILRAGGRIWQTPRIRSWYSPRSTLRGLFRQQSQYGYWKVAVMRKHRALPSLRPLIPPLFLLGLAFGWLAGFVHPWLFAVYGLAVGTYATASMVSAIRAASKTEWKLAPVLPIVFFVQHVAYGLGFLRGIWDLLLTRSGPSHQMTQLSRPSRSAAVDAQPRAAA